MNGGHDLGGMHGLGPIHPEPENQEPTFHAEWEKRVLALTLATGMLGKWNIDASRHARERQHPADYIKNSYYENWLEGLETLLLDSGLVTKEEITTGKAVGSANPNLPLRVPSAAEIPKILSHIGSSEKPTDSEPAFKIGDKISVRNTHPSGHTRAPQYVRGREGVIASHHGFHVFPDRAAHGPDDGAHLYSVWFTADDLWGNEAPKSDGVYVDLWEPHLNKVNI